MESIFSEANAGGYCHRSDNPDGSFRKTVWFSDEFTPRLEWTWGNNFFAAAAIRFYCWQRCACEANPSKTDPATTLFLNPIWNIIASQNIAQHSDGSLTLEATGSQQSEIQVLPPQTPPSRLSPHQPAAGTCGRDGLQFCPTPWPTDILGPISDMQSPPNATLIVKDPVSTNFTKCGQYCDTAQDCGPSDSVDSCLCALPSPKDSRTLGLDPITPKTICLALALAITGISGRDVPQYLDERGSPYQCACNSTYIASECCGSVDGRVWLP